MSEIPGHEKFTFGDEVGFTVNGGGNRGDAVAITGDMTVEVVSTDGGAADGCLLLDAEDGEKVTVNLHGVYWTNVAAGTTAGDNLTGSATAGELRPLAGDGTDGVQSKEKKAWTSANADGYALVAFQ